jgi:hypothetical protein
VGGIVVVVSLAILGKFKVENISGVSIIILFILFLRVCSGGVG